VPLGVPPAPVAVPLESQYKEVACAVPTASSIASNGKARFLRGQGLTMDVSMDGFSLFIFCVCLLILIRNAASASLAEIALLLYGDWTR
jgi:hypothetical protein